MFIEKKIMESGIHFSNYDVLEHCYGHSFSSHRTTEGSYLEGCCNSQITCLALSCLLLKRSPTVYIYVLSLEQILLSTLFSVKGILVRGWGRGKVFPVNLQPKSVLVSLQFCFPHVPCSIL